jgi:1-phosphatidylinositol-5-phosphate 4-kinase
LSLKDKLGKGALKGTAMSIPQVQGGLSKLKKKHFRVKHQKVKLFRANEPLLSVFMWGVNHTVSGISKC